MLKICVLPYSILTTAQALTQSCRDSYAGTVTGIGPEAFQWFPASCGSQPGVKTVQIQAK
jgi:hypothetical protein